MLAGISHDNIQDLSKGVDLIIVGEVLKATSRSGDLFGTIDFDVL